MGALAYLLWGAFPLYFNALAPASALEVLAHRIAWSSLTCAVLVGVTRSWGGLRRSLADRRVVRMLCAAAVLVAANWLIYTAAVLAGHVVEAALGYYINPLITVLLGVVALRERLRRTQWVAIGLAVAAVVVLTVGYGRPPWVAFALAVTFALYSLMKNRVGGSVSALHSLTIETWVLLLPSLAAIGWLQMNGRATFADHGAAHLTLMAAAGIVTSTPLLLFAGAASRIPLSLLGLLQYLTPTSQLLIGVLMLHEPMDSSRWIGFAFIWAALVVLSFDSVLAAQRARRQGRPVDTESPV